MDLSGIKHLCDECVRSVLQHCGKLRSLNLRRCTRLRGSEAAWHWLGTPGRENMLTSLNLSHCHALRDSLVDIIARTCLNLENLELAGCKRLTDASLRYLTGAASVPRLTALDLGHARVVTPAAVSRLLDRKRDLLSLNLGGCKFATDNVMNGLAVDYPHCRVYRR